MYNSIPKSWDEEVNLNFMAPTRIKIKTGQGQQRAVKVSGVKN